MNMIHTPSKMFSIEPLKSDFMELKGLVDAICETRSELCDVLNQMRIGYPRSGKNTGFPGSIEVL